VGFAPEPGSWARAAITGARHDPLWLADPARPAARASLDTDTDTDLLVVGGGFSGLWTALIAKERDPDRDVVLLEGRRIASAATGRNGGFVAASITHGAANGIDRWPHDYGQLHRLGLANLSAIEATIDRYRIDCGYLRSGELDVACEPYQVAHLADHVAALRRYGIEHQLLDTEQTRALVNSPTYVGSAIDPDVGTVDPARLAWGLAHAAASLGVRIYEGTEVTEVRRAGASLAAATAGGRIRARRIALGTAAHQPLLRRITHFVIPVFDHVVATAPLPEDVLAAIGWAGRQGIGDSGNQFHYYRLTPDNRIVWGGYDAVYSRGERPGSNLERDDFLSARLVQHLHDTFPQVRDVPIEYLWAGAIDTCSRFSGFWGKAFAGQLVYGLGYTGLGVGASRFGAEVMLDLADGLNTERTRLRMVTSKPLPFPPEPIKSIGINVTRASLAKADAEDGRRNLWLRTLDRVGLGFDS
jgi:glycine/D-amino acid oxidase-like deaminating enzyme